MEGQGFGHEIGIMEVKNIPQEWYLGHNDGLEHRGSVTKLESISQNQHGERRELTLKMAL